MLLLCPARAPLLPTHRSARASTPNTMIIFPEQYVPLYEAVKADAYASDDRKVVVFASAGEADSVCAVRILQVCVCVCGGCGGGEGRLAAALGASVREASF